MKGIQRTFTESRASISERNEWTGTLGRLNVLADEINRALCRATNNEESRSSSGIVRFRAQKITTHKKVRRGFLLLEG